jgi:type II secretory pathway pseudopilin PulG
MKNISKEKGITAIEALVGVSIAALILVVSTFTIVQFINTSHTVADKTQALYLAEEGQELLRFVRDNDWTNISSLSLGTDYYLEIKSADITTTTTPETIGKYSRSFTLENVERNGDDDIVSSGTEDNDSKYVTVTVEWGSPTQSVTLESILTNINP